MKNLKKYKFKYKYIESFFINFNIMFMKADTESRSKTQLHEIIYDGKTYKCIILNNKMSSFKRFEIFKTVAFHIIKYMKKEDYFYIDQRYDINGEIFLSKRMNIRMKQLDDISKSSLVIYNYFKIKDLIRLQGKETFLKHYETVKSNEYLSEIYRKKERGIIECSMEDYCYIGSIKNIIYIYNREIDNSIDYTNPSFSNGMLLKYLDNYYGKFAVIDYDKDAVKNFIFPYYMTERQSKDYVSFFMKDFLTFYSMVLNMNFRYKSKYDFKLTDGPSLSGKRLSKLKYNNYYKYFDKLMYDDNNYYNFMFILEMLELNKPSSDKKDIINFISVFELLLVKGNKNISGQIQNKCINLLNDKRYLKDEFKLVYDYRSKLIHGEYKKAIEKLYELSKLDQYKIDKDQLNGDDYFNLVQLIEEKVRNRMFRVLCIVLKKFILKNNEIKRLKNLNENHL